MQPGKLSSSQAVAGGKTFAASAQIALKFCTSRLILTASGLVTIANEFKSLVVFCSTGRWVRGLGWYGPLCGPRPRSLRLTYINLQSDEQTLNTRQIKVPADHKLWWPAGYGPQALYDLQVMYTPADGSWEFSSVQVRVGFRSIRLVQVRPPCICLQRCLRCVAAHACMHCNNGSSWTRFCACAMVSELLSTCSSPAASPLT